MNSYTISQSYNFQCLLWDIGLAVLWLITVAQTFVVDLCSWCIRLLPLLTVVASVVAVAAIMVMMAANPQLVIGLFLIGVYAVVTKPKAVIEQQRVALT